MAQGEQPMTQAPARTPLLPLWQKLMLGLLSLPLAALALPTLAVLAVGLGPTLCAFLADRSREKYLTITVALPNACGCLPALVKLWALGQTFSAAQQVLADPLGWAVAFGAAAIGWLVYMVMPPLVAVYYQAASQARQQTLTRLQQTLVETWGEEVAGDDAAEQDGEKPPEDRAD